MISKEKIRSVFLEKHKTNSLSYMLELCRATLATKQGKSDNDFKVELHGQIGEVALEMILMEFCRRHKDCFYFSSTVFLGLNEKKNISTEVDFILCTPYRIYLFEVKCYNFDKYLINRCTLINKECASHLEKNGNLSNLSSNCVVKDVAYQMQVHLGFVKEHLDNYRFKKYGTEPYKSVLFDFSIKPTYDRRKDFYRTIFPLYTERNTLMYLEDEYNENSKIWDVQNVVKTLKRINASSNKNMDIHVGRLKEKYERKL